MKKFLTTLVVVALTGCQPTKHVVSSDNTIVQAEAHEGADEVCYRGVVYVRFGQDTRSYWGGTRLTQDGKVVTCPK